MYISEETLNNWITRYNELETKYIILRQDFTDLKREMLLFQAQNKSCDPLKGGS